MHIALDSIRLLLASITSSRKDNAVNSLILVGELDLLKQLELSLDCNDDAEDTAQDVYAYNFPGEEVTIEGVLCEDALEPANKKQKI